MTDKKLQKLLQETLGEYEMMPDEQLFAQINAKVQKADHSGKNYRKVALALLFLISGLLAYLYLNDMPISTISMLPNSDAGRQPSAAQPLSNDENKIEKAAIQLQDSKEFARFTEGKTNELPGIKTLPAHNKPNMGAVQTHTNLKVNSFTKNKNAAVTFHKKRYSQNDRKKVQNIDNQVKEVLEPNSSMRKMEATIIEENQVGRLEQNQSLALSESSSMSVGTENALDFLNNKPMQLRQHGLAGKQFTFTIKAQKPPKELPKINKQTPLAFELGFSPLVGFQKMEATSAALGNIQNLKNDITFQERQGTHIQAGMVLNWTKRSRLRLNVSYKDIYQKSEYEIATDIFDITTINNQTVMVRRGVPFKEYKRNKMMGIKIDRQLFLQMNSPLRFYGLIGAEYNRTLGSSATQMLFVNTGMGVDQRIGGKWRLQAEPNYAYALLGTKDSKKNLNLNPNHLGLKIGLLYEVR